MKSLTQYLLEKLKVNSKSKISKNKNSEYLEPDEFEEDFTEGEDYNGNKVTIIGKPFKNQKDPIEKQAANLVAKKLKENHMSLFVCSFNDACDMIDNPEEIDYWCYAMNNENEIACFVYGPDGVVAKRK